MLISQPAFENLSLYFYYVSADDHQRRLTPIIPSPALFLCIFNSINSCIFPFYSSTFPLFLDTILHYHYSYFNFSWLKTCLYITTHVIFVLFNN